MFAIFRFLGAFWVHCLWAFGKVRTIPYRVFYCGQPTIKEVVGGCPHPAAEKRKYLPQTDKLFVGDDACIVPHDGQRKYILPKSKDVCLFGGQGALRPQARFGGQPDRRSGS